jgi:hypothetical protein
MPNGHPYKQTEAEVEGMPRKNKKTPAAQRLQAAKSKLLDISN